MQINSLYNTIGPHPQSDPPSGPKTTHMWAPLSFHNVKAP